MRFLGCLLILCGASAHATPTIKTSLEGDDMVWMSLSAAGGAAGGMVLGALLGNMLDSPCTPTATQPTCPPPAFTIAGAYSGLVIGSTFAAEWYGSAQGYRGRRLPTMIGAILGNVASGLPIVLVGRGLDEDVGLPLVLGLVVAGPAIGATLGYQYSLPDGEESTAGQSGALLDLDPAAGWTVQLPAVGFGPERQNQQRGWGAHVRLAGGVF
jgi:hypothetical protein